MKYSRSKEEDEEIEWRGKNPIVWYLIK